MRKYEIIWIQLKKDKKCSITAPVRAHPRIIKAVKKEKYNDLRYKFDLAQVSKRARLVISREYSIIHFKLIESVGINDI